MLTSWCSSCNRRRAIPCRRHKQSALSTSNNSPIRFAAGGGRRGPRKISTARIESRRGSRGSNIRWAARLERAGGQVVYGSCELNPRQVSRIVRREGGSLTNDVHNRHRQLSIRGPRGSTPTSSTLPPIDHRRDAARGFQSITGYGRTERHRDDGGTPLTLRKRMSNNPRRDQSSPATQAAGDG